MKTFDQIIIVDIVILNFNEKEHFICIGWNLWEESFLE